MSMKRTYRLFMFAVCFCSTLTLLTLKHNFTLNQHLKVFKAKANDKSHKPLIVIGVLTTVGKLDHRHAQRQTWLSSIRRLQENLPFRVVYKFWFDRPTPESLSENNLYGDIEYLNVNNYGYTVSYGEKLYVWMKYIVAHYPDAMLGLRVDDDVFVCVPQIFQKLDRIKSKKLYYGRVNSGGEVDEMLVVTGIELIKRISQREYCNASYAGCDSKTQLIEYGVGGNSLGAWLSIYDDVKLHAGNAHMIQHLRHFKGNRNAVIKKGFCEKFVSHHKSTPENMNTLHGINNITIYSQF